MYKIAVGCDPNAEREKQRLVAVLKEKGYDIVDFGDSDPIYANTAFKVAEYVAKGDADRGILMCGTGIGMSIAANKVKGAYAALITDAYSAERAQLSNNANIACFGALTLGPKLIETLALIYLDNEYKSGTGSEPKVNRYREYDMKR